VIGSGFNSPPANREDQRRCSVPKETYNKKVTDKTCCMHAEQRAIMDALRNNPAKLPGSMMYVARLDGEGHQERLLGKPYCTLCSKMALDAGIGEFALLCEDGVRVYDTAEYNKLSFQYSG
jgi:deoxycytidylate deaminase